MLTSIAAIADLNDQMPTKVPDGIDAISVPPTRSQVAVPVVIFMGIQDLCQNITVISSFTLCVEDLIGFGNGKTMNQKCVDSAAGVGFLDVEFCHCVCHLYSPLRYLITDTGVCERWQNRNFTPYFAVMVSSAFANVFGLILVMGYPMRWNLSLDFHLGTSHNSTRPNGTSSSTSTISWIPCSCARMHSARNLR